MKKMDNFLSPWKRITVFISVFALLVITIFGSLSINIEKKKYTKKWFRQNEIFLEDDVNYFLIDNPSWFKDNNVENVFSISYSFYGEDKHMEYDVGGVKLGYYLISGEDYGYTDISDNGLVSIVLSGDPLPQNSIYTKDEKLLMDIISTDLSKGKIEQKEDIDGNDVVTVTKKEYEMILYLDKVTGKCNRFEYIDKDGDNETFRCYITECDGISLQEEFNKTSSLKMTTSEFCEETDAFITGAMYMLQMNGAFSIQNTGN